MLLNLILLQLKGGVDTIAASKVQAATDTISAKVDSLVALSPDKLAEGLSNFNWNGLIEKFSADIISFGLKLLAAILVFCIGKLIINKLHGVIRNVMIRRDIDRSLATFLLSLFKIAFLFLLAITSIGIVGIETSSFIAVFASAGVAIGMALSGTLQNFAGGVLILLVKPYKVGDYIEFNGNKGFVKEIQIFNTIITTYNNEVIIIPNGGLSTGTINNYTTQKYRRLEWRISIAYGDDVDVARKVALEILRADSRVVKKYIDNKDFETKIDIPEVKDLDENQIKQLSWWQRIIHHHKVVKKKAAEWKINQVEERVKRIPRKDCSPTVGLESLADSAIVLIIRAWAKNDDYWKVYYDVNEKIYKQFPANGLNFPFPQMDVHVSNGNN